MSGSQIFLNGHLVPEGRPHLSALDRGFTLGDGVFDTLRVVGGRVFRLKDHLDRLRRSAGVLGLEVPTAPADLGQAIAALLAANRLSDALVRITLSRGVPAERGLLPTGSPVPSLAISAVAFDGYPEDAYRQGFTATLSSLRRNETSPLSRIKSCNYLDSVLARMEADSRGAQEALLLNTAGNLACGASSNLFLLRDGVLVTPSLDSGVLEGVTRKTILELAASLGLECQERRVSAHEIELAQELLLTNSAVGLMPVVAVEGRAVGQGIPGPVGRRLRAAYLESLQQGS